MKSIITAAQTREADRYTIETTPIASIDLMENASLAFVMKFIQLFPDQNIPILVCCGTGNNGGDGLAIARLLQERSYDSVAVWVARFGSRESDEFATNAARLFHTPVPVTEFFPGDTFPPIHQRVIIDALLGSGLNKPLAGDWLRMVEHINQARKPVVSVDIPTGLRADGQLDSAEPTIKSQHVISFQRPKLSFFFPESAQAMEHFHVVEIGLDEPYIEQLPSEFKMVEVSDVKQLYRPRKPFSHKGNYGHALIIAGETNTMGAALLACEACLCSGAGLTTACIPATGITALNTRLPEVMYVAQDELPEVCERFNAIGVGPGLGNRSSLLKDCLANSDKPIVIDADALTFLSTNTSLIDKLPANSILTPHMKEFDRLFGAHDNWWDRVLTARRQAMALQLIIVLKNRYTFIALPDGTIRINPTGNPAMASGGMGDVLTGMLTAFLAQGYAPSDAAVIACYLHGRTGDRLATDSGMAVVPAGVLVHTLSSTLGTLLQQR